MSKKMISISKCNGTFIINRAKLYALGSISMVYAPVTQFVHLYSNGVYMVIDERNTDPGRAQLTISLDPAISEYMLELDGRIARQDGSVASLDYIRVGTMGTPYRIRLHWPHVRICG